MDLEEEVESILHIAREISGTSSGLIISQCIKATPVFKIPPLKVNEGYRAAEWGDLGNPLWKGRLRIVEKSSGVSLLFEDNTTGMIASSLHQFESAEAMKNR
jgi:hypothetical protein